MPHLFKQIWTCSLPRLFQPHCDVQDSFLFPPCWCCVHDWNCSEVDLAFACWLWFMASLGESQEVSVSWYIAAPSPALHWRSWSLALNPSYAYWAKMIKIVAPWYFTPLVWHALQLSAMSATVPDVRHTMWSTRNTFGFGTLSLSLPKRFISTDVSPFSRYQNSSTRECCTGESSYRVPKHWEELNVSLLPNDEKTCKQSILHNWKSNLFCVPVSTMHTVTSRDVWRPWHILLNRDM